MSDQFLHFSHSPAARLSQVVQPWAGLLTLWVMGTVKCQKDDSIVIRALPEQLCSDEMIKKTVV